VEFTFSSGQGAKRRPAVVVSTSTFHASAGDLIVCPISSQPRFHSRPGPGDCPLKHWAVAGMRYPSTARVSNLASVDKRIVSRKLGVLRDEDWKAVEEMLCRAFGI